MADIPTVKVKIGIVFAAREIDIEVDDADAFIEEFESAMKSENPVWWVTDSTGRRRGLLVDKVSYVDIEPERNRQVGFG